MLLTWFIFVTVTTDHTRHISAHQSYFPTLALEVGQTSTNQWTQVVGEPKSCSGTRFHQTGF